MAFYAEILQNGKEVEKQWHVGTRTPAINSDSKVLLLMADGDELDFVVARFHNIPYCHPITKWEGEMASFIYKNLEGY